MNAKWAFPASDAPVGEGSDAFDPRGDDITRLQENAIRATDAIGSAREDDVTRRQRHD
jgi:hypothetical protein